MNPYWKHIYSDIEGIGKQECKLFKIEMDIYLVCSDVFGKSFKTKLREAGGTFKVHLKELGGECWKFSSDKAESINSFLKDVSTKAISPEKISDNIEAYIDIYKSMIELHKKVETVGQNEDDIDVILDKNEEDGFVTYMNFKPGDGGSFCVGNFNMNGKYVNIFQEDI